MVAVAVVVAVAVAVAVAVVATVAVAQVGRSCVVKKCLQFLGTFVSQVASLIVSLVLCVTRQNVCSGCMLQVEVKS